MCFIFSYSMSFMVYAMWMKLTFNAFQTHQFPHEICFCVYHTVYCACIVSAQYINTLKMPLLLVLVYTHTGKAQNLFVVVFRWFPLFSYLLLMLNSFRLWLTHFFLLRVLISIAFVDKRRKKRPIKLIGVSR